MLMEKIRTQLHNTGDDYIKLNIPMISNTSIAGRNDIINRDFVEKEINEAIGTPYDNERYQTAPYFNGNKINKLVFNINLYKNDILSNKIIDFGFDNDDFKFNRNVFKNSMLYLEIYDEPDDLNNVFIGDYTMKMKINQDDYLRKPNNFIYGIKDVSIINGRFESYNPKYYTFLNNEGYFLYLEKKEFGTKTIPKYLYMKCQFNNAKTGYVHLLGTKSNSLDPSEISLSRYIRIKLYNDNGNFIYEFDETFSDNITKDGDKLIINFYETKGN